MAKNYMADIQDLRGNGYLNPGWPANVRPLSWVQRVAVHHDASDRQHSYDSIQRYTNEAREHYNRLGPGLQYHFKIDNVGTIFWIRPLELVLYAVGDFYWNQHSISICLDGNFQNQEPTREQAEALQQLLDWLDSPASGGFPYTSDQTFPHRAFSATACCGDKLAWRVDHYRAHKVVPLDNLGYDWPEYQPAPAPVPPAPAPAPQPAPKKEWEANAQDLAPTTYYAQANGVPLVDLTTGKTEKTYGVNTSFAIARKTTVGGVEYLITQYSAGKNIWKGLPAAQLGTSQKPPSQADPTPLPTEPPVENPQPPKDVEQDEKLQDHAQRLSALEQFVAAIKALLAKIGINI